MRCDCGKQLNEAMRQNSTAPGVSQTIPGRGSVIYLSQEGRGIAVAVKLRAYNLQDMGHETLSANLMLSHGANERSYGVAAAILGDLGVTKPIDAGSWQYDHNHIPQAQCTSWCTRRCCYYDFHRRGARRRSRQVYQG